MAAFSSVCQDTRVYLKQQTRGTRPASRRNAGAASYLTDMDHLHILFAYPTFPPHSPLYKFEIAGYHLSAIILQIGSFATLPAFGDSRVPSPA